MLEHLLSPVRIGNLELPNRIVVAPMGVEICEADGMVREPVVAYYVERARGGAGLIITENTAACYPRGANSAHELGVSDDGFLPGLTSLCEGVHAHGGRIAIQLAHHGKVARLDTQHGRELLMPSIPDHPLRPSGPLDLSVEEMKLMAKAAGGGKPVIREATHEDLEQLAADFADAALRARRAGFDGVEIHGAHGYIFSEFLSPAWNRRSDEFGGSVENRARLLCNVLRACKQRTGQDFPIWCRIDAVEFRTENGITLEDATRTAQLATEAGADAIHVSAYAPPLGAGFTDAPLVHAEGGFAEFAATVKRAVSVPVIAVGRIAPRRGDYMIRDGRADLIAMGRQMLADPATPKKLILGRPETVRPCVYCYTCVAQPFFDKRVRCAVNPVTANEVELAERVRTPAPNARRVVVAGGGTAGLEAARVAALRGHQVTLCEKSGQLGGTLRFAAVVYEPNERLLDWLEAQVRALGVDVRLDTTLTVELARSLAADVVIVANGARRERPAIDGARLPHVLDGDDLRALLTGEDADEAAQKLSLVGRTLVKAGRTLGITRAPARIRELSHRYMPVGRSVVVIGGGLVGAELAEFLVERGRTVTVLDEGYVFALEMAHPRRWRVLYTLREAGVELVPGARVTRIDPDGVHYAREAAKGGGDFAKADSVILATGLSANPGLADELRAAGLEPVVIGDCTGVGYIEGAIHDAFHAALAIGTD